MNSPDCVAIIGILAEMTRCLKENIGKIRVAPVDSTLTRDLKFNLVKLLAGVSKA